MSAIEIATARCLLRPLVAADATPAYLSWLHEPEALLNISAAASTASLDSLQAYIASRENRDDVIFLGIFDRESGRHIGNVKYEPIDDAHGYAVMGILIGDPDWRGRGIAQEVLRATAAWLAEHRGIRQILLGVSRGNTRACRAYEAVGFRAADSPYLQMADPANQVMVWDL